MSSMLGWKDLEGYIDTSSGQFGLHEELAWRVKPLVEASRNKPKCKPPDKQQKKKQEKEKKCCNGLFKGKTLHVECI